MAGDVKSNITVIDELRDLIPPLASDDADQLLENIRTEGKVREALVLWERADDFVLVDGHNRLRVIKELGLSEDAWRVDIRPFSGMPEVREWMIRNQLGRRNLTKEQKDYLIGLQYETEKNKEANTANLKQFRKNTETANLATSEEVAVLEAPDTEVAKLATPEKTAKTEDIVAQEHKISPRSVRNAAQFAKGLDLIGQTSPQAKKEILAGDLKVKKSDIQAVAAGKIAPEEILAATRQPESDTAPTDPQELRMPVKEKTLQEGLDQKQIQKLNRVYDKIDQAVRQLEKSGFSKSDIRWMLSQTVSKK
ncbi:hypothetical protein FUAX_53510 (plasmid) [Fulvitalea axinellae]|uniref:ParB/Sulfiredoxin domain-containing protein n=2 Tax=Fulvitalea axinellae TaxID=1182444 RepID=A0AAU9DEQ3_9BACT|nr:hypothetical protein FUAX_53510 [Fulvitalea axinellae]